MCELGILDGSILKVDDFLQNYNLTIGINHYVATEKDDPLFKVVADPEDLKPIAENGSNLKIILNQLNYKSSNF